MHFAGGKWIWVDQEEPVYKRSKGKGKGQTKGKSKGGKAKGKGKRILGYQLSQLRQLWMGSQCHSSMESAVPKRNFCWEGLVEGDERDVWDWCMGCTTQICRIPPMLLHFCSWSALPRRAAPLSSEFWNKKAWQCWCLSNAIFQFGRSQLLIGACLLANMVRSWLMTKTHMRTEICYGKRKYPGSINFQVAVWF